MTPAGARGVARFDHQGVVAAWATAKWLRLAAAPTFAVMALLTVVLESGVPNPLCSAAGHLWPGGMAPMYLLMGVFHSVPWLKLIPRERPRPVQGQIESDAK
jgi:hypothetical protein